MDKLHQNSKKKMSDNSKCSSCRKGKTSSVVNLVVYYDTSKLSNGVSSVTGTKRVNVKLKKGGQELIEHMKKIVAHSDMKGDYNKMDETGLVNLSLLILLKYVGTCISIYLRFMVINIFTSHVICYKRFL